MTIGDAVRKATRIALSEELNECDALEALRFVRSLPREMRAEARAAVDFVYQHGHAPRSVKAAMIASVA